MISKIVIGLDCGASHSTVKVWKDDLVEFENHNFPGANFDLIDRDKIRENLLVEFEKLVPFGEAYWVVGMAGLDNLTEIAEAENWFRKLLENSIPYSGLEVMSDVEMLLWSGDSDGVGIGLIAGTGSNCFGKNKFGKIKKVGGMSHLLSDEGGGFALGWKCLHLVTKMVDGRVKASDLVQEVLTFYNLDNITDLKNYLLVGDQKVEIARSAPLLLSAADRGSELESGLVLEEVKELVVMVCTVNEYFQEEILPVYISGSVFKNLNYRNQFVINLNKIYPSQPVKMVNPIDGALKFVRQQAT